MLNLYMPIYTLINHSLAINLNYLLKEKLILKTLLLKKISNLIFPSKIIVFMLKSLKISNQYNLFMPFLYYQIKSLEVIQTSMEVK
jgi:hypothetical protein